MTLTLSRICRFPVKGLSGENLAQAHLVPGQGLPGDRRFALALASARFADHGAHWLPKDNFLTLARHPRLAALDTAFDDASGMLTICRNGKTLVRADILHLPGRLVVAHFFRAFLGEALLGNPRLVEAHGHNFTDDRRPLVSLIGAGSLAEAARVSGAPLDFIDLRTNLLIAGAAPWQEFGWMDREITVGAARLRIVGRIQRGGLPFPATVATAMVENFGHRDLGVQAQVVKEGLITPGAPVTTSNNGKTTGTTP